MAVSGFSSHAACNFWGVAGLMRLHILRKYDSQKGSLEEWEYIFESEGIDLNF
jgi:hypothetical protein